MRSAVQMQTTVLAGSRIELSAPELPEGQRVDVIVLWRDAEARHRHSIRMIAKSLPPSSRSYESWEEFEQCFRQERDSWER